MKNLFLISIIGILLMLPFKNTLGSEATDESGTVLQKIKEKVEAIRKSPKAYIGTITDKTESSLQIKNTSGAIEQISVKNDVSFVKLGKTTTSVKYSDVAIGDFIAALGLTNGSSILDARRVLLIPPIEEPDRKLFFAEVSEVKNKEITIKENDGKEYILTFPKKWKGPDIKEIDSGMTVAAVTTEAEQKLQIRSIEIIKINSDSTPNQTPGVKLRGQTFQHLPSVAEF